MHLSRFRFTAIVIGIVTVAFWLICRFLFFAGTFADTYDVSFDLSADEKTIFFTDWHGKAKALTIDSLTVRDLGLCEEPVMAIRVSRSGDLLAFSTVQDKSTRHPQILICRKVPSGQWLVEDRFPGKFPCFSDDGRTVYYCRAQTVGGMSSFGKRIWTDSTLWMFDLHKKSEKKLSDDEYFSIDDIAYDTARSRLVFSAIPASPSSTIKTNLFELPLNSTQTKQISNCKEDCTCGAEPSISPDGKIIAYISDQNDPYHYKIVLNDLETGQGRVFGPKVLGHYNARPVLASNECFALNAESFTLNSKPRFRLVAFDRQGKWRVLIGQDILSP